MWFGILIVDCGDLLPNFSEGHIGHLLACERSSLFEASRYHVSFGARSLLTPKVCRGVDPSPVTPNLTPKSLNAFKSISMRTREDLDSWLTMLCEEIAERTEEDEARPGLSQRISPEKPTKFTEIGMDDHTNGVEL